MCKELEPSVGGISAWSGGGTCVVDTGCQQMVDKECGSGQMAMVGASSSVLGGRYSGVSSVGVVCTPTMRITVEAGVLTGGIVVCTPTMRVTVEAGVLTGGIVTSSSGRGVGGGRGSMCVSGR